MILQILRIPVTKEFREYRCGTKPSKPFLTLIVEKAKDDKAKKDVVERPFSSDDLQMPVSVETASTSEEKPEEKPEEKLEEKLEEKPEEKLEEKLEEKPEEKPEEKLEEKPEEKPSDATEVQSESVKTTEEVTDSPLPSVVTPLPSIVPSPKASLPSVITPKATGGSTRSKRKAQHSRKIRSHR